MGIIKKYSPEISLFLSVCIALFIPFISSKTSLPLGIINNDIPFEHGATNHSYD